VLPHSLYCPKCDDQKEIRVIQCEETYTVRGEDINVMAQVAECSTCGTHLSCEALDEDTLNRVFDLYRQKHRLLTKEEIKEIRLQYGLSQRALARLLGWGEATIARYETGKIPNKSHDLMLRNLKSVVAMSKLLEENGDALTKAEREKMETIINGLSRSNMLDEIERAISLTLDKEPSIYNGYRVFDKERFAEVILYFAHKINPLWKTSLMKLVFYADFMHFAKNAVSITGVTYARLPYGPVPDNYNYYLDIFEDRGLLALEPEENGPYIGEVVKPSIAFNQSHFADHEIETLKAVVDKFGHLRASELSRLSHEEEAWLKVETGCRIPYSFADALKVIL